MQNVDFVDEVDPVNGVRSHGKPFAYAEREVV